MSDNQALNPITKAGNFVHATTRQEHASPIWKRFSLAGKTAIISGSGGGIGYAVATAYAEMGANVVIWYNKNTAAVEKAAALAKEYNIKCETRLTSITEIH